VQAAQAVEVVGSWVIRGLEIAMKLLAQYAKSAGGMRAANRAVSFCLKMRLPLHRCGHFATFARSFN
jgi:hypothetical protein